MSLSLSGRRLACEGVNESSIVVQRKKRKEKTLYEPNPTPPAEASPPDMRILYTYIIICEWDFLRIVFKSISFYTLFWVFQFPIEKCTCKTWRVHVDVLLYVYIYIGKKKTEIYSNTKTNITHTHVIYCRYDVFTRVIWAATGWEDIVLEDWKPMCIFACKPIHIL